MMCWAFPQNDQIESPHLVASPIIKVVEGGAHSPPTGFVVDPMRASLQHEELVYCIIASLFPSTSVT